MKILSFDSTARVASVAICDNGRVLASYNVDNGFTQSELLLPMAESVLKQTGLSFSDIDAYAVTSGPGSFTGVRIGVALVKGLAFGREIPCISVSTLEALSENMRGLKGIIVSAMDARRSQVYTALFRSDGENITRITNDLAISLDSLSEMLLGYKDEPIYVVGDGYDVVIKSLEKHSIRHEDTPILLRLQNAASTAKIAEIMIKNGNVLNDKELKPTYLRLPQAERERIEKEQGK